MAMSQMREEVVFILKKRPAAGQTGFGVKAETPLEHILGKPLRDRNLQSLRAGWKTELVGTGSHRRTPKLSMGVRLSPTERILLALFENDEIVDSEALWNKYYEYIGIECAPDVFNKIIAKLMTLGLIETESVRPGK